MTPETVMAVFTGALYLVLIMVLFVIVPGLIVGLMVAIFQAATQINEMTLSFVPRLIATILALMFGGNWLLTRMINYTEKIFYDLLMLIG